MISFEVWLIHDLHIWESLLGLEKFQFFNQCLRSTNCFLKMFNHVLHGFRGVGIAVVDVVASYLGEAFEELWKMSVLMSLQNKRKN